MLIYSSTARPLHRKYYNYLNYYWPTSRKVAQSVGLS